MFRVALTTKDGQTLSNNFNTKEECDMWILEQDELFGVKKGIIKNKQTNEREVIEL